MLEQELKSVVDDMSLRRAAVERAGAILVFEGRLEDRRYDFEDHTLTQKDQVLRVRIYRDEHSTRAQMDWKGPTRRMGGYKQREEVEARVMDAAPLANILERLGYRVTIEIDREVAQDEYEGAMIRF